MYIPTYHKLYHVQITSIANTGLQFPHNAEVLLMYLFYQKLSNNIQYKMGERKIWSESENDILRKLYYQNQGRNESQKMTWGQIANILNKKCQTNRSGKQCRERWHNQLNPNVAINIPWSKLEEDILFDEQAKHGNKWSKIAQKLNGRTDNNIKNYFYSTLRKAMRKINLYLSLHKKEPQFKNTKEFPQQILSKILSVADENYLSKVTILDRKAESAAKQIKNLLVTLQRNEAIEISRNENTFVVDLIHKIQDFNRLCKKRKSKKKQDQEESDRQFQEVPNVIEERQSSQSPIRKLKKTQMIKKPIKPIVKSKKGTTKCLKIPMQKLKSEGQKLKSNPSSQQLSSSLKQSSSLQKSSSFRHSSFKEVVPEKNLNVSQNSQFFLDPPPPHQIFSGLFNDHDQQLFPNIRVVQKKQEQKYQDYPLHQLFRSDSIAPNTNQNFNIFQKSAIYSKDNDINKFSKMTSSALYDDLQLNKRASQRLEKKRSFIKQYP